MQPTQSPWLQTFSLAASPPAASHHYHYSAETGRRDTENDALNVAVLIGQMRQVIYNNYIRTITIFITHNGCSFTGINLDLV